MANKRKLLLFIIVICPLGICIGLWLYHQNSNDYDIVKISPSKNYSSYFNLMINDNNVVVGVISVIKFKLYHVFSWDQKRGFVDLGPLCSDGSNIWLEDINNKGQFIGSYRGTESLPEEILSHDPLIKTQIHSFMYDPENRVIEIIAMQGCFNPQVKAINDKGDVIGFCDSLTSEGKINQRIFLWNTITGIHDLNIIGIPYDINHQGHIVGIHPNGTAFFWSSEEGEKVIGRADECHINDSDEVAGIYDKFISKTNQGFKVFRWNQNLGFQNLDSIVFKTGTQTGPIISCNSRGQFCRSTNNHIFIFGIQMREQIDTFIYDPTQGRTCQRNLLDNGNFLPDMINDRGRIIGLFSDESQDYPAILIPKEQRERASMGQIKR
jgi:hypothetical protein